MDRTLIISGPAKVTFNGATFFSKGDIETDIDQETMELETSLHGKVDERVLNITGKISFEPAGEWESLSVVWPYGSYAIGASIFGSSDLPLVIHSLDGKTYTFAAAAITKMPNIICSTVKTLIGPIEFTAIRAKDTPWGTADSFLAIASSAFSETAFNPSDILTQPYDLSWDTSPTGGAPWDDFESLEGVVFEFPMSVTPVGTDRDGILDYRLQKLAAMARCIPIGPTTAEILTALKIQGSGAARGRSLNIARDFVADGTGVTVTLKNAGMKSGGYAFGQPPKNRNKEVTWVATKNPADLSVPLFTVGT